MGNGKQVARRVPRSRETSATLQLRELTGFLASWKMLPMNDQGFEIEEGVLSEVECRVLTGTLSQVGTRRTRAGARHLMSHPEVAELARGSSLLRIAKRWVGPQARPYRATLFEKTGEHNWLVVWHQDTALPLQTRLDSPEWGPWSTKDGILYAHAPTWALTNIVALRLHLDPSSKVNGPLRVIPGSHHPGVLSYEEVLRMSRERRGVECLSGRGGVVALRPLLIHASSKAVGPEPRRVLHIEYAASLDLAPGIRLALA